MTRSSPSNFRNRNLRELMPRAMRSLTVSLDPRTQLSPRDQYHYVFLDFIQVGHLILLPKLALCLHVQDQEHYRVQPQSNHSWGTRSRSQSSILSSPVAFNCLPFLFMPLTMTLWPKPGNRDYIDLYFNYSLYSGDHGQAPGSDTQVFIFPRNHRGLPVFLSSP